MQVEHKTEKGTVLFVQVPDDAIGYSLTMFDNIPHLQLRFDKHPYGDSIKISRKRLEYNPWQLIGLTSEVTEEIAKIMVDKMINSYKDYADSKIVDTFSLFTALDSFKSLMLHLQVYEVNTIAKPNDDAQDGKYLRRLGQWQEAEARTGEWVVLFK